jgi:branched-chain amino acid transport system permease protein
VSTAGPSIAVSRPAAAGRLGRPLWWIVAAALVLAAATPWLGSRYHVSLAFFFLMHLALTATYDIVGGYMGYVNLGHGAFFGLGAYVYGLTVVAGAPVPAALALAVVAAGVFAGLVSVPVFRLRGVYFAIATFGILKLLEVLAANLEDVTGGTAGLSIPPTVSTVPSYYAMLAAAVAAVALNAWIAHSRLGLGLVSVREDEEVAETSGVDTRVTKRAVFVLGALLPGLVGGVYMWQLTYVDPTSAFGLEVSFPPVIMAMLGGTGTVPGPVVGTLFLTIVEEALWSRLGYLQLAMYGLVLVFVGLVMPGGLMRSPWLRRAYGALGGPGHAGFRTGRERP